MSRYGEPLIDLAQPHAEPERLPEAITGGRLARNAVLNLSGFGVPLLVALLAIPPLARGLGTERFGLLTLCWAMIGYFSLFDLGVARALTKLVAERMGAGRAQDAASLVWTGLVLMATLGLAGGLALAAAGPALVRDVLVVPEALRGEALGAAYLIAASIPVVISAAGLRGVLEAQQRFGLVNLVRITLGLLTFLGPLCVLPFSTSLIPVAAALGGARLLAWFAYFAACLAVTPALRRRRELRRGMVWPLLRFGGWMTVTNLVNPLMAYLDRFLIGSILSLAAVAYYATPHELATKAGLVPEAMAGVLFPALSASAARDRASTLRLFESGLKYAVVAVFPIAVLMVGLAEEGLRLWLGPEFAGQGAAVLRWLAVGVFLAGFGQIGFALVQGLGRPDLTAKVHLVELPAYLIALWWLTRAYGIEGAAIAWALRAAGDSLLLVLLAYRLLDSGGLALRHAVRWAVMGVGALALCGLPFDGTGKLVLLAGVLAGFSLLVWTRVLDDGQRQAVSSVARRVAR